MRPIAIPHYIMEHNKTEELLKGKLDLIRKQLGHFYSPTPDVSIIIPAYNEEAWILKTLSSLSGSSTKRTVEIIVVNNNSTDKTGELALAAGAKCILETRPGITAARNAGLKIATGKFIMNADADTIYPPDWIDTMLYPFRNSDIVLTYGIFSFIPGNNSKQNAYLMYEQAASFSRWLNKKFHREALNIYGFNSAFKRGEGIAVGGFDHPAGTNEDGWLAVKLRNGFNKRLHQVTDPRARVWTSDRRIQMDGGIYKATLKRLKRYFFPPKITA